MAKPYGQGEGRAADKVGAGQEGKELMRRPGRPSPERKARASAVRGPTAALKGVRALPMVTRVPPPEEAPLDPSKAPVVAPLRVIL